MAVALAMALALATTIEDAMEDSHPPIFQFWTPKFSASPSDDAQHYRLLIGIALDLQIALDSILIFTILILPIHENSLFLHLFVSSLISFISVLQFSIHRSFVSLGEFNS